MKVNIKDKNKIRLLIVIVIILAGAVFVTVTDNGLLDYLRLQGEKAELREDIERAKKRLSDLEREIDSLKHNKEKIEKYARENYMMKKSNEEGFSIEEK